MSVGRAAYWSTGPHPGKGGVVVAGMEEEKKEKNPKRSAPTLCEGSEDDVFGLGLLFFCRSAWSSSSLVSGGIRGRRKTG